MISKSTKSGAFLVIPENAKLEKIKFIVALYTSNERNRKIGNVDGYRENRKLLTMDKWIESAHRQETTCNPQRKL